MQPFSNNISNEKGTQQPLFEYHTNSSIAPVQGKKVAIDFQGGTLTSDVGVLLLRETEAQCGIIKTLVQSITDQRRMASVTHSSFSLIAQRIYQIAAGYEDGNDSNTLRFDSAFQMAVDRLDELASQPTFSRLENRITRTELYRMGVAFVDNFLVSFYEKPEIIVLDFDDTASVVYGHQQMALFNGYYEETCYQPLHVYEGLSGKLITTILRPGKRPDGKEIVSYGKRIITRLRQQWPNTIFVYRGDSHYSAPEVFTFLEQQQNCHSITGLTSNKVLQKQVKHLLKEAKQQTTGYKRYHSFTYQAESWSAPRRVVAKVEITAKDGLNVRFISTDMWQATAKVLYEEIYCARGNDELYIKEHKTYTKSDRTSCHRFTANQFRLFLHSAAYVLLHAFRSTMLKGTSLATATFESIRLKLLKVGARIMKRKTKISVHLPTGYPYQSIFSKCLAIFEHLRSTPYSPLCTS